MVTSPSAEEKQQHCLVEGTPEGGEGQEMSQKSRWGVLSLRPRAGGQHGPSWYFGSAMPSRGATTGAWASPGPPLLIWPTGGRDCLRE